MKLLNDEARCHGTNCPSKGDCLRYTDRPERSAWGLLYAAFPQRREDGASACDSFLANRAGLSTFAASEAML